MRRTVPWRYDLGEDRALMCLLARVVVKGGTVLLGSEEVLLSAKYHEHLHGRVEGLQDYCACL